MKAREFIESMLDDPALAEDERPGVVMVEASSARLRMKGGPVTALVHPDRYLGKVVRAGSDGFVLEASAGAVDIRWGALRWAVRKGDVHGV